MFKRGEIRRAVVGAHHYITAADHFLAKYHYERETEDPGPGK